MSEKKILFWEVTGVEMILFITDHRFFWYHENNLELDILPMNSEVECDTYGREDVWKSDTVEVWELN